MLFFLACIRICICNPCILPFTTINPILTSKNENLCLNSRMTEIERRKDRKRRGGNKIRTATYIISDPPVLPCSPRTSRDSTESTPEIRDHIHLVSWFITEIFYDRQWTCACGWGCQNGIFRSQFLTVTIPKFDDWKRFQKRFNRCLLRAEYVFANYTLTDIALSNIIGQIKYEAEENYSRDVWDGESSEGDRRPTAEDFITVNISAVWREEVWFMDLSFGKDWYSHIHHGEHIWDDWLVLLSLFNCIPSTTHTLVTEKCLIESGRL